jgi:hypothetical protein
MRVQVLSIPKDTPTYRWTQTLNDVDYQLELRWNMRAGWFLSMADRLGDPIFAPRRVVADWDLLLGSRHDARCPPGVLAALDLTGQSIDPGYNDLCAGTSSNDPQGRVALSYIVAEDV